MIRAALRRPQLVTALAVWLACLGVARPAHAEDESPVEIDLTLYSFLAIRIEGELSARGLDAPFDTTLKKVFDKGWGINAGLRAEVWTPLRLGVVVDGYTSRTDIDADRRRTFSAPLLGLSTTITAELETETRLSFLDLFVGYRVADWWFDADSRLTFDVLAGARITDIQTEVSLALNNLRRDFDKSQNWAEPACGAQLTYRIGEVVFGLRGDLSGFGVGSASDLTANVLPFLRYQPSERLSLDLGYRLLVIDYSRGSGASKVSARIDFHGPQLGIGLHF